MIETAGKVVAGKFCILDPQHPRELSKGKSYNLINVRHEGKKITGEVSVIDGSSKTGTRDMHLTITLKESFNGDRVRADVQVGHAQGQAVVFSRQKG